MTTRYPERTGLGCSPRKTVVHSCEVKPVGTGRTVYIQFGAHAMLKGLFLNVKVFVMYAFIN